LVVKTTIEIDDALLKRAKVRAAEEGVTLRAIIERALRQELEQLARAEGDYVLRDASVRGEGIDPAFLPWHWDKVRDLVYGDRGA
jgi:hypothetical protein